MNTNVVLGTAVASVLTMWLLMETECRPFMYVVRFMFWFNGVVS